MTRWTVFLLVFAFAAPLWAVKVKLKSEDKEFEADILKLEDGQVTYKKGRKENTVPLNDFEPESQFVIKDEMTGNLGHELLGLARFALHRGLYRQARDTAKKAMLDDAVKDAAQRLMDVALILEADTALDKAIEALDAKDVEKAGPMLQDVKTRYASTPAALKAEQGVVNHEA